MRPLSFRTFSLPSKKEWGVEGVILSFLHFLYLSIFFFSGTLTITLTHKGGMTPVSVIIT
jgi:hypothetical protein